MLTGVKASPVVDFSKEPEKGFHTKKSLKEILSGNHPNLVLHKPEHKPLKSLFLFVSYTLFITSVATRFFNYSIQLKIDRKDSL